MPLTWGYTTAVAVPGTPFDLPLGDPESLTVVIVATNTVPLTPLQAASLTLTPGGAISVDVDSNGWIGVAITFTGCGPDGTGAPDGTHYAASGSGGVFTFPDGIWGQQFTAALAFDDAPDGTTVDIVVQSGSGVDDLELESDPPDPDDPDALYKPSDLLVARVGATFHLSWHDNSDNETRFAIDRRDNLVEGVDHSSGWQGVNTVPANTTTYIDADVDVAFIESIVESEDSSAFVYRVYAYNATKKTVPTYAALRPTVLAVMPPHGGTRGFDPVVVTGTGFLPGATVTFGGVLATTVDVIDPSHLTCLIPAHAVGVVNVVVTNPDTTAGTLINGFRYETSVSTPAPHAGGLLTAVGPLPSTVRTRATVTRGHNNGIITYQWAALTNPAPVTISTPTQLNTDIVFTTYVPGTYAFTLTARDEGGIFAAVDTLYIVVPLPVNPRIRANHVHVGKS